jgi:hypothetical protein
MAIQEDESHGATAETRFLAVYATMYHPYINGVQVKSHGLKV